MDIVETLRRNHEAMRRDETPYSIAADEIERLREQVAEQQRVIDAQYAEIEVVKVDREQLWKWFLVRRKAISDLREIGWKQKNLAQLFDLSVGRIRHIIKQARTGEYVRKWRRLPWLEEDTPADDSPWHEEIM